MKIKNGFIDNFALLNLHFAMIFQKDCFEGGGEMKSPYFRMTVKSAAFLFLAVALGLAASTAGAAPSPASPSKFSPSLTAVVEEAKKEGGEVVIFWGSAKYGGEEKLSKAMSDYYGFPIKVKSGQTMAMPPMIQKLIDESKRNIPSGLDAMATSPQLLAPLVEAGLLLPLDWVALGAAAQTVEPKIYGVRVNDMYRTVLYNTKLVKREEAPRKYLDLLDPKWKGKICTPAFGDHFALISYVLGEKETKEWAAKLKAVQGMIFVPTYTDTATRVGSGEFPIGLGYTASLGARKGAPVANAPLEKAAGMPFYGVVLKDARHPAMAKLYMYFVSSTPQGRLAYFQATTTARTDTPGSEAAEIGGGGRGVLLPYEWYIKEFPRLDADFRKILELK